MTLRAVATLLDPRTPFSLAREREPADLADYYRFGAEYVQTVATAMEFAGGDIGATIDRATAAMTANRTAVGDDIARSIASVLLGDVNWWLPLGTWVPLRWAALSGYRAWPLFVHLRRVGRAYASNLDAFVTPTFSSRWDVTVAGQPAVTHVDGYADRLLLADSLLHLEWFVAVAADHGITVPGTLIDRTRRESIQFYTGHREEFSPSVGRFQYHLFADGEWIRRVADRYTGFAPIDEWGIRAIERTRRQDLAAHQ